MTTTVYRRNCGIGKWHSLHDTYVGVVLHDTSIELMLLRANWAEDYEEIQLGKSKSLSHVEPSFHYRHTAH
jgi:hypothetical protein